MQTNRCCAVPYWLPTCVRLAALSGLPGGAAMFASVAWHTCAGVSFLGPLLTCSAQTFTQSQGGCGPLGHVPHGPAAAQAAPPLGPSRGSAGGSGGARRQAAPAPLLAGAHGARAELLLIRDLRKDRGMLHQLLPLGMAHLPEHPPQSHPPTPYSTPPHSPLDRLCR